MTNLGGRRWSTVGSWGVQLPPTGAGRGARRLTSRTPHEPGTRRPPCPVIGTSRRHRRRDRGAPRAGRSPVDNAVDSPWKRAVRCGPPDRHGRVGRRRDRRDDPNHRRPGPGPPSNAVRDPRSERDTRIYQHEHPAPRTSRLAHGTQHPSDEPQAGEGTPPALGGHPTSILAAWGQGRQGGPQVVDNSHAG